MANATVLRKVEAPLLSRPQIRHFPAKRIFDILFSLTVLVLGSPVFFIVAMAIRIGSKGPALYSQERIGRGGKTFRCWKFRSMYVDADARLANILQHNPKAAAEWKTTRKLRKDPRITPLGHWLRRTSLDETPQFWNVLRGDLSVVGPRPVVEEELRLYYGPRAPRILSIRPGLTGIWQVSGRNNTTYEARIEMDEEYLERRNFWLDLYLVLKTIPAMVFPKGAY